MTPQDFDPMDKKEMNRDPHDVDKGLNTKMFLQAVVVALVLILVGALVFVRAGRSKELRHSTAAPAPNAASPQ